MSERLIIFIRIRTWHDMGTGSSSTFRIDQCMTLYTCDQIHMSKTDVICGGTYEIKTHQQRLYTLAGVLMMKFVFTI